MNASFIETMRGRLTRRDGRTVRLDFQLRTEGGPLDYAVRGIVHAPPFVSDAPCTGTLTMRLWPASIAYELHVRGANGDALVIEGRKNALRSMIRLPLAVRRGGEREPLASGEVTFDPLDALAFARSWLPFESLERRRFEARFSSVSRHALVGG